MYLIFSVAKLRSEAQIGHTLPQNLDMGDACEEICVVPFLGGRSDFREVARFKDEFQTKIQKF